MPDTETAASEGPEYGGRHTRERIANLRSNVEKHDWVRNRHDKAVKAAGKWVSQSDEQLWRLIPCQNLPRNIDPQMHNGVRTGGCPACDNDVYAKGHKYPWRVNVWERPWKVECPSCGALLPGNDFGAFYESGIDETGCFSPERADRSLLHNSRHPDSQDPLHGSLVDDGWGFDTPDGAVNRFVGYYGYALWKEIKTGVAALGQAYLYTGDPIYARKCGLMLDRIADVYPDMDWSAYGSRGWFHSGSQDGGKIEGSIWEVGTVTTLADAYDKVKSGLHDQPELLSFLSGMASRYRLPGPKGEYRHLTQNIEANLLGEFVKAVKSGRKIYGNEGGPQHCVVISAVALDRQPQTSEWLDWLFEEGTVGQGALKPGEGGHIPALIVGAIDRDGVGAEGAPSYSLMWGTALGAAADLLHEYDGYTRRDIYRDYPQFKRTFTAGWRLGVLASHTPNIGDCGGCGTRGLVAADPQFIVRGYRYLKDPEIGLAAVHANHGKTEWLGRDAFEENPFAIEQELAVLAGERGIEPDIYGANHAGYGLVSVEYPPRDSGQAIWMFYGLNSVAAHKCALMFGYEAFGVSVCPTLGYRELWGGWPKSIEWEDNTISHNTVVVDQQRQSTVRMGRPELFAQFGDFGGFSASSPAVYPDVTQVYRRTMASVRLPGGGSYAVDVFHVKGGREHLMSYHALPGPVEADGLRLTAQSGGSYAGADVPYGTSIKGRGMGYSWLKTVERDTGPPAAFTLDVAGTPPFPDLEAADDIHVRYHAFTEFSDVALADGVPPGAKPPAIRYFLGRRTLDHAGSAGEGGLASTFVALIEPYRSRPEILSATRLTVSDGPDGLEAVALKVELNDGATDYLMVAPDDTTTYRTQEGIEFRGRLSAARIRDGAVEQAWLARAARLVVDDLVVDLPDVGLRGQIVRLDRDLVERGHVWVDTQLPTDGSLVGSEIIIDTEGDLNGSYAIHGVEKDGNLYRVDCGEGCFVRGFVDSKDYGKGHVYNFEEGARWLIPNRLHVDRRTGAGH